MATALLTLDQVKLKLQIPLDDTDDDAGINNVLNDVEQWILGWSHIDLDGGNSFTELHRNVQIGQDLYLRWRPVATVSGVTGRFVGGTNQTLEYDLLDPEHGVITLIGSSAFRTWPPVETERPLWFRWRERSWPVVNVSYHTSAFPFPKDLSDAAAAITAAYWEVHQAGLKVYSALGSIIERYGSDPIPVYCLPVLRKYQLRQAYGTP